MSGGRSDLMPGERLVLGANPHWWYFWKEVLAGLGIVVLLMLTFAASGAVGTVLGWLTLIVFIAWLVDTGYRFAQWRTTRFSVTDHRVTYQSGLFRRRGVSIPLNRVNNVNFEQSFVARVLGNGVVTIESAGEGDSVFENIPDPDRVRQVIFQQMEAYASSDAERDAAALARAMQSTAPSTTPATSSVEDRLAQLDQLRAKGVLSDAEYEKKRTEILDSL
jgi:uncharacterized membrane protein YdbT with pleckstrin-like domain